MEVTESGAQELLERALRWAKPWDAEAILAGGHCTVLRFANNRFHQNTRENRLQLQLRVVRDGHTGSVTVDDFSDESLRRAAGRARAVAQASDPEEEPLPLLEPQTYSDNPHRFDPDAATQPLEWWQGTFSEFFAHCESARFHAAGKLERVVGTIGDYGELSPLAMANSRGLFVYSPATWFDFSTTVFGEDSAGVERSGWAGNAARRLELIDLTQLCSRAFGKATENREPRDLPPGRYRVILEPAAVKSLLGYLFASFNAQTVLEDRSYVSGRRGAKDFPEWFSLRDDAYDPRLGGCPFDGEGVPTRAVSLIENGVIRGLVNTRALARQMKEAPTGHGYPVPNPVGASPNNVVCSGGTRSLDEIIASTEKAILVTRIWYTTAVDEKQLIITGMTRDGTFLVEDGRIVGCVKNLRFNQSIPELLANVIEAGAPEPCFGSVLPALLADKFHFTSATAF